RLSVLPLQWAPLRDRLEDIIPLAEKLLQKHAHKQNRRGVSLSPSAQQMLLAYPWPGNVRELDNIMQRALILQPGRSIQAEDLGLGVGSGYSQSPVSYSQKPNLLEAANAVSPMGVDAQQEQPSFAAQAFANASFRASQFSVA